MDKAVYPKHGEMGLRQVKQGISSSIFCQNFDKFDDFSKFLTFDVPKIWKIIKYTKNLTKNEENPYLTYLP